MCQPYIENATAISDYYYQETTVFSGRLILTSAIKKVMVDFKFDALYRKSS